MSEIHDYFVAIEQHDPQEGRYRLVYSREVIAYSAADAIAQESLNLPQGQRVAYVRPIKPITQ